MQQVEDALKNEEVHQVGSAAAAAATAVSPALSPAPQGTAPVLALICAFCGRNGHSVEHCFKFADSSKKAKEEVQQATSNPQNQCPNRKGKASAAQEASTPVELGEVASIRVSSPPSSLPDAWNADTGATSHMTPHREWFHTYSPCSVPIRVANGQVVFAAGRGTVEFTPVKGTRNLHPVVFFEVLHVPALNQNLLSVLTITSKHGFDVWFQSNNTVDFIKDSVPRFHASVGADRVALLCGTTVVTSGSPSQRSETAGSAQLSYELWHRRFGHICCSGSMEL